MTATRVIVADDSALIRDGVARLLADQGFDVVGQAAGFGDLIAMARDRRPDIVVTDIRMPPGLRDEGIVATFQIRRDSKDRTAVLVLSQYLEPEFAVRLLEEGGPGLGYLLKDRVVETGEFVDAVRRVARGDLVIDASIVSRLLSRRRHGSTLDGLSEREREVLRQMAEGRSNLGIAERLFLSEKTVEGYVGTIFAKLGIEAAADDHRRVLAVLAYLRDG
ncbi:MAG TPA: response regulator transcription factor [Candidatus Limnocylindrales bacterium]